MIADASGSPLLPHQRTIESLWTGEDARGPLASGNMSRVTAHDKEYENLAFL